MLELLYSVNNSQMSMNNLCLAIEISETERSKDFQDTFCHSSSTYHGINSHTSLLPISGINAVVVVIKSVRMLVVKFSSALWLVLKLLVLCPIWLTSLESLKFVDTESIVSMRCFYFIFVMFTQLRSIFLVQHFHTMSVLHCSIISLYLAHDYHAHLGLHTS